MKIENSVRPVSASAGLDRLIGNFFALAACLLVFTFLSAAAHAQSGSAAPIPVLQPAKPAKPPPALKQTPAAAAQAQWRRKISAAASPPGACATASFPAVVWKTIPCGKATAGRLALPAALQGKTKRSRILPRDQTGNVTMATVSGTMTTATGSFRNAVDLVTEAATTGGANTFTLQLNTNAFDNSAECSATGAQCTPCKGPICKADQQFAISTSATSGTVFIQYWLTNYDPTTDPAHSLLGTCPAGWQYSAVTPQHPADLPGCLRNGNCPLVSKVMTCTLPPLPITGLNDATLEGQTDSQGNSIITATYGDQAYRVTDSNMIGLPGNWKTAQFNIFGNGDDGALVNPGAITGVELAVNGNPGQMGAVSCLSTGSFTAEYNNFVENPDCYSGTLQTVSQIDFSESVPANIERIVPSAGPMAGGTKIDVYGTGFLPTTLQNQSASNDTLIGFIDDYVIATCDSSTHCTVVTPRFASIGDILMRAVNNTATTTGALTGDFVTFTSLRAPQGSMSPAFGPTAGGTTIAAYGSDLWATGDTAIVDFNFSTGAVPVPIDSFSTPTNSPYPDKITFTAPPLQPAGPGPVAVPVTVTVAGETGPIGTFTYGPKAKPPPPPPPPVCHCGDGLHCCPTDDGRFRCLSTTVKCPILQ